MFYLPLPLLLTRWSARFLQGLFSLPARQMVLSPIARVSLIASLGLALAACSTETKDDDPSPAPPSVKSRTTLRFGNFVTPSVPGSSSDMSVYVSPGQAYGSGGGTYSYGFGAVRTLEWYGSDSATVRVAVKIGHAGTGTNIDNSQQYDRRGGYWHFLIGSAYAPYTQNVRLVQRKYYEEPSDSTLRTFAYLNADPSHSQVKVYYNGTEIGEASYGVFVGTVTPFRPNAGDVITAISSTNPTDTVSRTEIGSYLTDNVSLIVLKAVVGRRNNSDYIIYRHQIFAQ